jgi:hypothetical protein
MDYSMKTNEVVPSNETETNIDIFQYSKQIHQKKVGLE